jgi:hypothetical protein
MMGIMCAYSSYLQLGVKLRVCKSKSYVSSLLLSYEYACNIVICSDKCQYMILCNCVTDYSMCCRKQGRDQGGARVPARRGQ